MELSRELLSPPWFWFGHAVLWPVLGWALYLTVRVNSRPPSRLTRAWPPACVAVLLVWQLKAGVYPGLSLHLLGATLLTLMFGWRLALIGLGLVVAVISYKQALGWLSFGLNAVVMGLVPVVVSRLVDAAVQQRLPYNPFAYIFVSAFAGAALAVTAVGLVSTAVLLLAGVYAFEHLLRYYIGFYPLLIFPEAFLTGGLISVFVAYRPQWVVTFDDKRYALRRFRA